MKTANFEQKLNDKINDGEERTIKSRSEMIVSFRIDIFSDPVTMTVPNFQLEEKSEKEEDEEGRNLTVTVHRGSPATLPSAESCANKVTQGNKTGFGAFWRWRR